MLTDRSASGYDSLQIVGFTLGKRSILYLASGRCELDQGDRCLGHIVFNVQDYILATPVVVSIDLCISTYRSLARASRPR